MKIHLATDHAGFLHKEALKQYLQGTAAAQGSEVIDHGDTQPNPEDDYPDFITPCAQAVAADATSVGIIFGHSGEGEAMCANRIPGARAVVYYGGPTDILTLSRAHNNANILSIAAGFVPIESLPEIISVWLNTSFSGDERHIRRLSKLDTKINPFDIWNEQKKYINQERIEGFFQERDVVWCSVGKNVGFEQDGKGSDFRRPVLVVKKFNRHVFLGIPVTTKLKPENKYYHQIDLGDGVDRSLVLSQVRLFDAKRLTQKLGVLNAEQFVQTKNALARILHISAQESWDKAEAIT